MYYLGDISATEAYELLKNQENSYLIDVRTTPEWIYSGVPDLTEISKRVYTISWMFYPDMHLNQEFTQKIEEITEDKEASLLFLCKVGGRSAQAANETAKLGYANCYNISDGFEGDHNESQQRGQVNGWKAAGLPWVQS